MKELPTTPWPLPPLPIHLEDLCDRFEAAWKGAIAGAPRPRLEEFIAGVAEPELPPLMHELVALELGYRRKLGETLALAEYQERFPGLPPKWLALELAQLEEASFAKSKMAPVKSLPAASLPPDLPSQIDCYRIERVLGEGGFGRVLLGYDDQLRRPVAIKVPHPHRIATKDDAEAYLTEARTVASLDHPNIVTVYRFGSTERFPCFVVSRFIDGTDLAARIQEGHLPGPLAIEVTATMAEALHHAHMHGLVHRDVKPNNILLDQNGKAYLADFGIALREQDSIQRLRYAGTPAYMSPEQARGEGHRVDGRSDIFSLGVVIYELLTGRRPFSGKSPEELRDRIIRSDPKPLRQIDDRIPKELERICLKALSKRASERYTIAKDLAEDLRHYLLQAPIEESSARYTAIPPRESVQAHSVNVTPAQTQMPASATDATLAKIVPKGLRSFDGQDADFFLELLAGPRDRDGLPDSIRFWKTRIEETDADNTFSVGLIYGPSGCGKSSFIKGGLLPRLSADVIAVYVEATTQETESRILHALRKRCPALPANLSLAKTLAALRRERGFHAGKKVVIVLDQFEQWLHAHKEESDAELVQALRHCDGGRLQCIVLVRDDFWLAVSRFVRDLDIDLVPGRNIALVDLFDLDHARKVLAAFGRAFKKLPEARQDVSKEQNEFLKQAIAGLAQENKINCVRLALFAEMMKGRPWTAGSLRKVGGMQGIGVAFLEDTFSGPAANPKHRLHQKAARRVLKALLPEGGRDIKGNMRSEADLLKASGYPNRKDFDALIQILDPEVRLLTPTVPEGNDAGDMKEPGPETASGASARYYQLTHDYLVHSLRDWLNRKQGETLPGRAELRLADQAAVWNARPGNRQLPSLWQWLQIKCLTRKTSWTPPQRTMMAKASRYHGVRMFCITAAVILVAGSIWEYQGRMKAHALAASLLRPGMVGVSPILDEMARNRRWVLPLLLEAYDHAREQNDSERLLKIRLALLRWDSEQAKEVYDRLLDAKAQDFAVVRAELAPFKQGFTDRLWTKLEDKNADTDQRFRAACALADYAREDTRWAEQGPFIVKKLAEADALALKDWKNALDSVGDLLLPALASALEEGGEDTTPQRRLVELYAGFCAGKPDGLLLLDSRLSQLSKKKNGIDSARRTANVAAVLVGLQHGTEEVWRFLIHSEDPTTRSFLIERLGAPFVDPKILEQRLATEPEVSARRAILLALGATSQERLPGMQSKLADLYKTDRDAGIHGAAGYVLGKWGFAGERQKIDEALATGKVVGNQRWYVTKQRQTFSVLEGPGTLVMRGGQAVPPAKHHFAIAATEVTIQQFRVFLKDQGITQEMDEAVAPTEYCPVNSVKWHEAARYCNWLSKMENIPETEYCYRGIDKEGKLFEMVPDYQSREGYRLPTIEEWQFACRAHAKTPWSFGVADGELAGRYAWWFGNSRQKGVPISHPAASLKPNDFGLFDMHGNVAEWCQESKQLPVQIKNDIWTTISGGQFTADYLNTETSNAFPFVRQNFANYTGFRVARTIR